VSHQPERKEKDCLNCGTITQGRYCHVCGQENIVTKQNFWALSKHFIYDVFHFDGKFFDTLQYLLLRPGFIAKEYIAGKRQKYLDPIRMYLFTSAVFFLIFFSFGGLNVKKNEKATLDNDERVELARDLQKDLKKKPGDSLLKTKIALLLDTTKAVSYDSLHLKDSGQVFSLGGSKYHSLQQYDSVQQSLPSDKKDGWFVRRLNRKSIQLNEKYKNEDESVHAFLEIFLHKLPYMLFLSLPFFALILKLLYVRHKNFYYSDHAIFTLYHYVFSFILLLLVFGVAYLDDHVGWGIFSFLQALFLIAWPVYLLLEMKNFYGQSWGKTFGKFLLLNFLGVIILIVLFILVLFFSIFQM